MVKLFAKTELMVQFYKNRTYGSIVTIEPTSGTGYKPVPAGREYPPPPSSPSL